MQRDRNYRYAPTFSGGVGFGGSLSQSRENNTPDCRGNYPESASGCNPGKEKMVLAMAYVLNQPFENLYTPEDGFRAGTIFKDLNLPYGGGRKC